MADIAIGTDRIEVEADLGDDDAGLYAYWMGQDRIAAKEEETWAKRGRSVVKRYRDERPVTGKAANRFNILWSNVQTLLPTLYARTPKADVQRRFLDQDDTGRLAALLLERSIEYSLENSSFDAVMEAVVEDRLLPGRGTARVMYVPHYGDELPAVPVEGEDVDDVGDEAPDPLRAVDYEEGVITYVYWEDYREGTARTWREVPWVRYRSFMTRDELVKRFGKKGKTVNLDYIPKGASDDKSEKSPADIFKKAEVFEFWDKIKKRVIWLAPGTPDVILDDIDDPLKLPEFFPSPDPLLATTTTSKRIPVPDYAEYQDQAAELDTLTARIDILTKALKLSGVYPGQQKAVLERLIDGGENVLIPVEDWQAYSDKGGLAGFIQWMPIKEVADTLIQLYAAREKTKELLYEITGIGDIMRGQTDPNETMGAQQLKANFSTRRIQPQQRAVARVARDLIRLLGGVIAEHFSAQTISMITGYPQLAPVPPVPPPPPQVIPGPPQAPVAPPGPPTGMMPPGPPQPAMVPNPAFAQWQQIQQASQAVQQANQQKQQQFEAACALLKSDGVRGFKLDIEADSTIAADEQAEKQARTEFLQQMIPMLEQVVPLAQGNPPLAALAKEMSLFAVRGFRVARTLEEAFEKAFDAIAQMPPNPKVSGQDKQGKAGPDPQVEQAKIAATVHDTQMKAQTDQLAIAQKAQQATDQLQATRERAAAEDMHNRADLALRGAELHQRGLLEAARMEKIEASSTAGLT